jgi:hypothetical protein
MGQIPDIIFLSAKPFRLYSTPLDAYLQRSDPRPVFNASSTANWRGYIARWEVFDNRLFLTGLFGIGRIVPSHLIDELPTNPFQCAGDGAKPMRLADLFPEQAPLVFAEWVTEHLILPAGPSLRQGHDCFGPVRSTYRAIDIAEGRVRSYRDWNADQWGLYRWLRYEPNPHQQAREIGREWPIEASNNNDPRTLVPPHEAAITENALVAWDRNPQIGALCRPCGQMPPPKRDTPVHNSVV